MISELPTFSWSPDQRRRVIEPHKVIRCRKRYVAREVFAVLNQMAHNTRTQPLDIYTSVEYAQVA